MKKTATLMAVALLGAMSVAFGGQKLNIAQPVQQEASPWAVEIGATYNWGMNKFLKNGSAIEKKNHVNTLGGDITGVYNLDENNAVTLRFGYAWGQDKFAVSPFGEYVPSSWLKETSHTFSLMPGYRYTVAIDDKWSVYGGVNIGISNTSIKLAEHVNLDRHSSFTEEAHGSAWGFAYSVEVGANYAVTDNVKLFAAGTFSGNTATPKVKYDGYTVCKGNHQVYLGVRAGVSYSF